VILVQVQVGMLLLVFALRVWRKHGSLRNCQARFESSAGRLIRFFVLGVCRINARELAKLVDQVRFLARTLERFDAGARRRGNRLGRRRAAMVYGFKQVRLLPASLTIPTADSDYILKR
jgi:hypothetical protein